MKLPSPSSVDSWAITVIDAVRNAGQVEDSRVELKAQWPADPAKAARRIAGHLNASQGESVLWLIGVSDEGTVLGTETSDFADWWARVAACFDGPVPHPTEVNVYHDDGKFLAICLDGPQVPYLVKNPDGGGIAAEVPWRAMTGVRTAKHADLLRILAPRALLPEIEVLGGSLSVRGEYDPESGTVPIKIDQPASWWLSLELYCVPADHRPIVLPSHRTTIHLTQQETVGELYLRAHQPEWAGRPNIMDPRRDASVSGPGRIRIMGTEKVPRHSGKPTSPAIVEIAVRPAWHSLVLGVRAVFGHRSDHDFRFVDADISWRAF